MQQISYPPVNGANLGSYFTLINKPSFKNGLKIVLLQFELQGLDISRLVLTVSFFCIFQPANGVWTYESRIPPSPNLEKVTVSFDKLNNTDLFHQIFGVYIVQTFCQGTHKINWPNQLLLR